MSNTGRSAQFYLSSDATSLAHLKEAYIPLLTMLCVVAFGILGLVALVVPDHGDHGLCGQIPCVRGKLRGFGRLDVPQASHKPFSVRRSAPSETTSGEGFEQLVDVIHVVEHGWRHSQVIWAHPHMHFPLAQPLRNGLGVFPL